MSETARDARSITGRGFQIFLSRSFVGEVLPFISALEVAFLFPTSSAEMKGKTSPTKLLDKTIWNPRPMIDLASRAVSDKSKSEVLPPFFNRLETCVRWGIAVTVHNLNYQHNSDYSSWAPRPSYPP